MDLFEHQGMALFAAVGLPVVPSRLATSATEAREAASGTGVPVAVKAQVKTGGRGKAGGVRLCRTPADVESAAAAVLSMSIGGRPVDAVLVQQAVAIAREMYLAISSSRAARGPLLIFSREGGVDIEEVAQRAPAALVRTPIDPLLGLCDYQVRDVLTAAALGPEAATALAATVRALWRLYAERDATLTEVNPLVLTDQGHIVCLDSKVSIDDNALYRQSDLPVEEPEDEREAKARRAGLAFVPLDGDIGVLANGAGLAMSITAAGGAAANFCDIGGGARADVVAAALDAILSSRRVTALLVSIFGGITRCDEVAYGLTQALAGANADVPVVVRLEGNAAAVGRAILADSDRGNLTVTDTVVEAVRLVVAAARSQASAAAPAPGGAGAAGAAGLREKGA
jgi:succinyl-CoA synthetase beta subunit